MRIGVLTGRNLAAFALSASLSVGLAAGLSGCGKKAPEAAASSAAPAVLASLDATPENAPGTTLTNAVVQLPAVPGHPGVAYFTLSQGSGPARSLVAVHVDGAGKAEMHENTMKDGMMSMTPLASLPLAAGQSVEFKPGGNHVMLFDLAPTLKAGSVTEVTITLDNGDKASAKAKVLGAGEPVAGGGEGMGDMDMKGMDKDMDMDHMDHMKHP